MTSHLAVEIRSRWRLLADHKIAGIVGLWSLIGLVAYLRMRRFANTADIRFDDEAIYLAGGLDHATVDVIPAENSPLYSLWYLAETHLFASPVDRYFGNWQMLLCLNAALFAAMLVKIGIPKPATAVAATFFITAYYFDVWPFVSLFCGLIAVSVGLTLVSVRDAAVAFSSSAALAACGVFARAETLLTFFILLCIALVHCMRSKRYAPLLLPATVVTLLLFTFGPPTGHGRLMMAFGQHYALNVVQRSHLDIDSWNHWEDFVARDFPGADTPVGALESNPAAFLHHLATNAINFPTVAFLFAPSTDLIQRPLRALIALVIVCLLGYGSWRALSGKHSGETSRRIGWAAVAFLVPSLAFGILLAPRLHYFIPPACLIGILGCSGFKDTRLASRLSMASAVTAAAVALTVVPWGHTSGRRPNLLQVAAVNTLPVAGDGLILEPDFGRAVFGERPYQSMSMARCRPFMTCARNPDLKIIVCDGRMRSNFANDPTFAAFTESPMTFRFETAPVSNTDTTIYFRR